MTKTKVCRKCHKRKSAKYFYANDAYRDGLVSYCKLCNKKVQNQYNKTSQGKKATRRTNLKKCFGISVEEYEALLKLQKGKCAICKQVENTKYSKGGYIENLGVDHNHKTKQIRGLLCRKCNLAIGLFGENTKTMKNAIKYLNAK